MENNKETFNIMECLFYGNENTSSLNCFGHLRPIFIDNANVLNILKFYQ